MANRDGVRLLTKDGAQLWYRPMSQVVTDIAWPSSNVILVAADRVYDLDVHGDERWARSCDTSLAGLGPSKLTRDAAGCVFLFCHLELRSLGRDGSIRWRTTLDNDGLDDNYHLRPFLAGGSILVYSNNRILSVNANDGTQQWSVVTPSASAPQTAPSGVVMPGGKAAWWLNVDGHRARFGLSGPPSVAWQMDKTSYRRAARLSTGVAASKGSGIVAWNDDGSAAWQIELDATCGSQGNKRCLVEELAVDAEDTVIAAVTGGRVLAVDGGVVSWVVELQTTSYTYNMAIGDRGDVLVGTDASELYCIGEK